MVVQIDNTNTLNKGAELMLYAVLEQLEKKNQGIEVYYNSEEKYLPKIETNLKFKKRFILGYSRYIAGVLRRIGLPFDFFTKNYANKKVDVLLDAGGFQFSDQWNYSPIYIDLLERYYKKLKENGTKIIFLPQALGPFEKKDSKRIVSILDKYADVIVAREKTSYSYMSNLLENKDKLWCYPDFTLKVEGTFPERFADVKGEVCVIPNKKMISHTNSSKKEYLKFYSILINQFKKNGKSVFLLNHEGEGDLSICNMIKKEVDGDLQIVDGLNAKEVKAVIGASELVVSSRFHGVASALSQQVPCLATSWSHKYELMFNDYGLTDMIINLNFSEEELINKVENFLNDKEKIKLTLSENKKELIEKTNEMWDEIDKLI